MANPQTRNKPFPATLVLFLALIGAASMIYYHQGLFMPRVVGVLKAEGLGNGYSFGNDFYQVWFTCRELLRARRDPYAVEITRDIQMGLYGRLLDPHRPTDPEDQRAFPYPAYADLLFWPTARVSFPVVRVAVLIVLIPLTLLSILLWMRAVDCHPGWQWTGTIVLLSLSSYMALEAFFAAQIGLVVLFLLAATIVALQRGRFLFAGFLIALATVKPQVVVLPILYLLCWAIHDWKRRGNFVIGFFVTMGVLFGISLLILPHWIQSWVHNVVAYRNYTMPPLVVRVLTSPLGPRLASPVTAALTLGSLALVVVLAWRYRRADINSLEFWFTMSLLLTITTIIVLPGQAVYDHLILLPVALLLVRERGRLRSASLPSWLLLWIGTVVLFWPWVSAFAMIALRPIVPPEVFNSRIFFLVPLRTSASMPFVALILVAWTWRLTIKSQQPLDRAFVSSR